MAKFFIDRSGILEVNRLQPGSLWASVQKWIFIASHIRKIEDDGRRDTCSLCQAYADYSPRCYGCPVKSFTGHAGCLDTPYQQYCNAMSKYSECFYAIKEALFLCMLGIPGLRNVCKRIHQWKHRNDTYGN